MVVDKEGLTKESGEPQKSKQGDATVFKMYIWVVRLQQHGITRARAASRGGRHCQRTCTTAEK